MLGVRPYGEPQARRRAWRHYPARLRAPVCLQVRHRLAAGVVVSSKEIDINVIPLRERSNMKPKVPIFSPEELAAEKAPARERDEELLGSGEVSNADMAGANGGSARGVRYKSPAKRIQALAASQPSEDDSAQLANGAHVRRNA